MNQQQFKRARMALGLNGKELAAELEIDRATVSLYENGHLTIPRKIELALKGLKGENDE